MTEGWTIALSMFLVVATVFTLICVVAVSLRRIAVRVPRPGGPVPVGDVVVLRPVEVVDAAWLARISAEAYAIKKSMPGTRIVVCGPSTGMSPTSDALTASGDGLFFARSDAPQGLVGNRKVRHLAAGAQLASTLAPGKELVLVQADQDVHLDGGVIRSLVDVLEGGNPHDLAFALPAISPAPGLANLASRAILMGSPQSFAVVDALARVTGAPPAIAGKCVAFRASTLARLGGHAAIEHAIGDDVALVERIRTIGGDARPLATAVATDGGDGSFTALLGRMTRWLRVIRAQQRGHLLLTFPFLIAPLPIAVLLALVVALTGQGAIAEIAPWLLCALFGARALLLGVLASGGGPYRPFAGNLLILAPFAALLGDVVLLLAFGAAVWSRKIVWAGRVYDVDARGHISAVRSV